MPAETPPLPQTDLDDVLSALEPLWQEARGARFFITGGTGFFGSWLLETFVHANARLHLDASITVLTRSPENFRQKSPHLANRKGIELISGDVRSFDYPAGSYDYFIHGAVPASDYLNRENPLEMFDILSGGAARVLEFAEVSSAKKFLLLSSGAIYGVQPPSLSQLPEEFEGGPDTTQASSAYAEGKRVSEFLSCCRSNKAVIARCFAFVGPHLPLDRHFAIGNFIRDALNSSPIIIKGDGRPRRSYLYSADLAVWLWTLLFRGVPGRAYNVGSARDYSIAEIAEAVNAVCGNQCEIRIQQKSSEGLPPRYVPCVKRAATELGLSQKVELSEAVRRTVAWLRMARS